MTLVIRAALDDTMWSLDYADQESEVFSIVKITQNTDHHIDYQTLGEINFDDQKYKAILENQIPLKNKKQYFELKNEVSKNPYCRLKYKIESDYLCLYDGLYYEGVGEVVDDWTGEDFPESTTGVVKIQSDKRLVYIYAYKSGDDIVFCERLITKDALVYNRVLTTFKGC